MRSWNETRRLYLATAPAAMPVTLQEAKDHLRVDFSTDDTRITRLIATATAMLDAPSGLLGGCIVTQSWRMTLRAFPHVIEIPFHPLQSVDSVQYLDASGTLQTLSSSLYTVVGERHALIIPALGTCWPSTQDVPEAVKVTFTAGYDVGGSPLVNDVPEPIKEAVLQLVEMRFDGAEVDPAAALAAVRFLIQGYARVDGV